MNPLAGRRGNASFFNSYSAESTAFLSFSTQYILRSLTVSVPCVAE